MTKPRQILPNSTYLVSRRCSERRFFLRPDGFVVQMFLYLLGYASAKFNIHIHAFVVLSNHWHCVVTDPDCNLPQFLQTVHNLVAKSVNAFRGRWEALWSSERCSCVRLEDREIILEKMVYVLTNPVAAGLVRAPEEWMGLLSQPNMLMEGPLRAVRPTIFFRQKYSKLPPVADVILSKPPGFEDMTNDEFAVLLDSRIRQRTEKLRREMIRKRRSVLGMARVMQQHWNSAPRTIAPRRNVSPLVAASTVEGLLRAFARIKEFHRRHFETAAAFRSGNRNVVFPHGTYWYRYYFRAKVDTPHTQLQTG